VLDPFCGTATSGEVVLKLGRNFVGIELYDDYAEIAEERCRLAQRIYEARNPLTPSAATFAIPVNEPVPDEMSCYVDSWGTSVQSQPAF
jgi:DNA modification methylase